MKVLHTDKTMSAIHQRLKQNPEKKILSLWKEGAPSRKEIISYVEAVTDKNSKYYIPPKDRIAVSDMDGTLFCETDPTYFDFKLLMYRVLEDEVYRELATEEERTVVKKIQDFINTGESAEGLEYDAGQAIASTFSGMTVTEFGQYVRQFGELPAPGYDGMKAGEAFYRPMVQILSYLRKNGFSVYVCSGTDRMVVREIVSGVNRVDKERLQQGTTGAGGDNWGGRTTGAGGDNWGGRTSGAGGDNWGGRTSGAGEGSPGGRTPGVSHRKPEKKPIHMLGVISGILGMLWRWMNIQMNCEFSATIINRLKNAKSQ